MEAIRFSIIIPVYNVANYLDECLTSLHLQTFSAWEGCCVDDGSQDASGEMLTAWIRKDKRIRATFQRNAGLSAARNRALKNVTGRYVGFVDSDDAVAPWWLEEASRLLQQDAVDLVRFAPLQFADIPSYSKAQTAPLCLHDKEAIEAWGWRDFLIYSYMPMSVIRREIAVANTFIVGVQNREDTLYDFKMLPLLTSVVITDMRHYFYRRRPQSLLSSKQTLKVPLSVFAGLMHFSAPSTGEARRSFAIFTFYTVLYWLWNKINASHDAHVIVHDAFKRTWNHLQLEIGRDFPLHWRVSAWCYLRWRWTVPLRSTSFLLRTYGKVRALITR